VAATHPIRTHLRWTGAGGTGTTSYTGYSRDHETSGVGKLVAIPGSSDPAFRGDAARYSPEEFLIGALASCHMLWVLHLAATRGVVIVAYEDAADGTLEVTRDGGGRIVGATLHPRISVARGDPSLLPSIHEEAHRKCFIANSVNFPVRVEPTAVGGASSA
jgi:organic hydroperoxide reductase OsmC/OhrA